MIVLDTHALLWWVDGSDEMPARTRRRIDTEVEAGGVHVSSISAWEIGMLVARKRLELTMSAAEWVARCEALPFLTFVPVDNAIALASTSLPGRAPRDPADRIVIATAVAAQATIVTKDVAIQGYDVPTFW